MMERHKGVSQKDMDREYYRVILPSGLPLYYACDGADVYPEGPEACLALWAERFKDEPL